MFVSTAITIDLVANLLPAACGELRRQAVTLERLHCKRRGTLASARSKRQTQALLDERLERGVLAPRHRLAALEQFVREFDRGLHMVRPYCGYGSYGNGRIPADQGAGRPL